MSLKTLVIYENIVLFNVLNEISKNFNFKLINLNKLNYNEVEIDQLKDYLVLCKKDENLFKQQLVFKDYPIKIHKLLEIINVRFLKNKFNFQSEINIGPYKLNLNSREISSKNTKLDLTEREANVLIFIYTSKKPVSIDELQNQVWGYVSKVETHTVETHIYRLRKKIKEKFNNDKFIISTDNGYVIE